MIRKARSSLLGAIAATTFSFVSLPTFAGDTVLAESLYQEGLKLYEQKKYDEACPKFAESQHQDPATGTLVALAKCYDEAGKTASAWAQYKELAFVFKREGNSEGEKAASNKAAELEKHLSKLQINALGETPGLMLRRDGEELSKAALGTPVAVDPGKHIIEATAPGYEVWQTTIEIGKDGDMKTVNIPALSELPKPEESAQQGTAPSSTMRTAGFALGGVGAAGLLLGGIFGGLAMSDKSAAEESGCDGSTKTCSQAGYDLIASANTKAWVSTIGIGVGAAALGTGVVLLVLSGNKSKEQAPQAKTPSARVIPSIGPRGGGLSILGSF